jgi:hypothetical protein
VSQAREKDNFWVCTSKDIFSLRSQQKILAHIKLQLKDTLPLTGFTDRRQRLSNSKIK